MIWRLDLILIPWVGLISPRIVYSSVLATEMDCLHLLTPTSFASCTCWRSSIVPTLATRRSMASKRVCTTCLAADTTPLCQSSSLATPFSSLSPMFYSSAFVHPSSFPSSCESAFLCFSNPTVTSNGIDSLCHDEWALTL